MRTFDDRLTAVENMKGVLDVDSVKGCSYGMKAYPGGGCYGLCYACKMAKCRGFDFSVSVSRQPYDEDRRAIEHAVSFHKLNWFRIGTMGDPSHDWPLTLYVCEWLGRLKKPVIVTKHWRTCPSDIIARLSKCGAVFNTSVSALDSEDEREYRLDQFYRVMSLGCRSFLRVVTCKFNDTDEGKRLASIQTWLLSCGNIIDTPLRIPRCDSRVCAGTIIAEKVENIKGESTVSRWNENVYIGHCSTCPDQCGVMQ